MAKSHSLMVFVGLTKFVWSRFNAVVINSLFAFMQELLKYSNLKDLKRKRRICRQKGSRIGDDKRFQQLVLLEPLVAGNGIVSPVMNSCIRTMEDMHL